MKTPLPLMHAGAVWRRSETDLALAPSWKPERPADGVKRPGFRRRILFLQTDWPMGMVRLAKDLESMGHEVVKVVLQPSDFYYALHGIRTLAYRGRLAEWQDWLTEISRHEGFDTFMTFNHLRPYNRVAIEVASGLGIEVGVIELGLIRPQHLTAYLLSSWTPADLPELWERVRRDELSIAIRDQSIPEQKRSVSTAHYNFRFFCFAFSGLLGRRLFPHYHDQRRFRFRHSLKLFLRWLTRGAHVCEWERALEKRLCGELSGRFFLVPLQLPHDTQIVDRSPYETLESFLEEVLISFKRHAPREMTLVLKTHPQDPGMTCYHEWLEEAARRHGLHARLLLINRCDLPNVLHHARGVVTVNSTVGLTALRIGTPVKPMGEAIYDLPGLTATQELDAFWSKPLPPEDGMVPRFVRLLESTVQGRGSLVRRCYPLRSHCGVLWPAPFAEYFQLPEVLESQVPHAASGPSPGDGAGSDSPD